MKVKFFLHLFLITSCSSHPPSKSNIPSDEGVYPLIAMCKIQPDSPWCSHKKRQKKATSVSKEYNYFDSYREATRLFNKVYNLYSYTTDKKKWGQRDFWFDYRKHIIKGIHFSADCEDVALTWGSIAYQNLDIPAKNIRLVRGLSDRGERNDPDQKFDHAWVIIKFGQFWYAFDIFECQPVFLQDLYHKPYDYIIMKEFTPKRW